MGQLNGGQFVARLFEMVSGTFVLEILSAEAPLRNDLRNTVDAPVYFMPVIRTII